MSISTKPADDYQSATRNRLIINTSVIRQILVVLVLLVFSAAAYCIGSLVLNVPLFSSLQIGGYFNSVASNLLVAVAIFVLLERGIESLHRTTQLPDLPIDDYLNDIRRLRPSEPVRILDTFTYLLSDQNHMAFRSAIESCRAREKEILLVHPHSAGARRRAVQLKETVNVEDELRKNLARLYKLQQDPAVGKLTVRLYTALPTIAVYRWGGEAYISLFPVGTIANECPNFRVSVSDSFGRYVDLTFNDMFRGTDQAKTIDLVQHMEAQLLLGRQGETSTRFKFAFHNSRPIEDIAQWELCYALGDEVSARVRNREEVILVIDGMQFRAKRYYVEVGEPGLDGQGIIDDHFIKHARKLISERYEDESIERRDEAIVLFQNLGLAHGDISLLPKPQ